MLPSCLQRAEALAVFFLLSLVFVSEFLSAFVFRAFIPVHGEWETKLASSCVLLSMWTTDVSASFSALPQTPSPPESNYPVYLWIVKFASLLIHTVIFTSLNTLQHSLCYIQFVLQCYINVAISPSVNKGNSPEKVTDFIVSSKI